MPSFMGRECIITAMPAEVHYDGGSEGTASASLPIAGDEKGSLPITRRRKW
jgi:hypothetical protein